MEAGSKIKVGEQWVEIEARYSHKNYQLDEKNDIALLKLKQPITSITPANIYKNNDELGKSIWFIGSGGTGTGLNGQTINLKENNRVLRKAQNRIVDIDDTDIIFEFEKGDDGEPLEGVSGNGDSGGPAYIFIDGKYQLLGISSRADSWFKDVGEYGVREVYTRVSSYQTWISQVINGSAEQRDNITTQNRFLQDNMKGNIDKVCNMVGF
jgi:secreted trypsin-like serine protease